MNTTTPATLEPYQLTSGFFLNTINSQPLHWLWPGRIPFAHLTLLHGLPGIGLSLFSLHLAACVTAGRSLPDGSPCQQGNVILIAPFDAPAHTIKPRLEAAGGEPSHLFLLNSVPVTSSPSSSASHDAPSASERPFSLAHDLPSLEAAIQRTHARLVILDSPDVCRDNFMRPLLPRLAHLAQGTNCAILLLRPLTRPLPAPITSRLHTLPLLSAVHSALLITADPENDQERLLITTKHSLSPSSPVLCYDITIQPSGTPALQWLGESSTPLDSSQETQAMHSAQRQLILEYLKDFPTPLPIQDIAFISFSGYEATRKMLQRMVHAGELISPSRGLYTTPLHSSPVDYSNPTDPVPNVPNISNPESSIPAFADP